MAKQPQRPALPCTGPQVRFIAKSGRHPQQVVEMARRYTTMAIKKLAMLGGLTDEKLPRIQVMNKHGDIVEVDQEIPAAVQLKALELLIERGYGKAPQAILLSNEGNLSGSGPALTIEQKIAAIKAARDQQGQTTDLEASEITEVESDQMQNVTPEPDSPAESPGDLI